MLNLHYLTHNIIIGKAELFYIPHLKGWITPGGVVIKDKVQAIKHACKLHDYIMQQTFLSQQKEKK